MPQRSFWLETRCKPCRSMYGNQKAVDGLLIPRTRGSREQMRGGGGRNKQTNEPNKTFEVRVRWARLTGQNLGETK